MKDDIVYEFDEKTTVNLERVRKAKDNYIKQRIELNGGKDFPLGFYLSDPIYKGFQKVEMDILRNAIPIKITYTLSGETKTIFLD